MPDWVTTAIRWLLSNRRIEIMQAEIDLLKTNLGLLQNEVTELRRIIEEKKEKERRLMDDLHFCQNERTRLSRENYDLLVENRALKAEKG